MTSKPIIAHLMNLLFAATITATGAGLPHSAVAQTANRWWSSAVEKVLTTSGANRMELEKALALVQVSQRDGLEFLLVNMPEPDLASLSASYLLENIDIAYHGLAAAPWKDEISKALFLNEILPYSCLSEMRDESRKVRADKAAALIAGCKTPGEAAQRLNQKIFPLLNARYSTERKRPDQSPLETVESGKATCSGLSILLVDACRAVGIPARVAGTPMWTNMRGNHTWVEVWDNGWHYAGAAEPDANGLDHGWFAGDAAKAQRDVPEHAIYASSFRKTGTTFPLVWAPEIKWVNAENVTDRYVSATPTVDASKSRILVKVLDTGGKRVSLPVTLTANGETPVTGTSHGETADMNDILGFDIFRTCPPRQYRITVQSAGGAVLRTIMAGMEPQELVTVKLPSASEGSLERLLDDRFGDDKAKCQAAKSKLAAMHSPTGAQCAMAWEAYKVSTIHDALRQQFEKKIVATDDRTSPYLWRHVGTKPTGGWALVIAMHGGGGAPKEVNDREWQYMFSTYYKEHPEAGGYVYLALRAPNDAWNGFYDDAISPLVEKLIKQFVLFDDVNPDKVYILGASHGGYGAYVIGPKIPYRFAAIHAAAAAASDGETAGENLRNVRFTSMVGEKDTAYGRIDRSRKFQTKMDDWRKQYGGYAAEFEFPVGVGHLVPDHDKLAEMLKYTRNAWPKSIVWAQSDSVLKRNYWVEADKPINGGRIEATVNGNTITLKTVKQNGIALWLDPALVDFKKPVIVDVDGKIKTYRLNPSLETYCEGSELTADAKLAAQVRVDVGP